MIKLIKKLLEIEFVRFLAVGGINTLFGYSMFAIFTFIGFEYHRAILFSTILGVIFNYKTIGKLVFNHHHFHMIIVLKFVFAYGLSYFLNTRGVSLVLRFIDNTYIAGGIVILPVSVAIYLLNKFFVFRSNKNVKDSKE